MTDTTENTAFVRGDGSQIPIRFLDLPAWSSPGVYQRDALEHINSGANGVVTADGIIDLQNALPIMYQPNAVFLMCEATWNKIVDMRDGNNNFLMPQKYNAPMLMNRRVILLDGMPPIAANSLSIAYGDFGVGFAMEDGIYTRHNDPFAGKAFTEFYAKRGDVLNFETIKILKLAA